jgi:hypothetical protein
LNTVAQTKLVRASPSCENAAIAEVTIQRTPCHIHFVQSMNSLHLPSPICEIAPPTRSTTSTSGPTRGTDNAATAMQAYLDWEFGLVEQLARDGTHGFEVF